MISFPDLATLLRRVRLSTLFLGMGAGLLTPAATAPAQSSPLSKRPESVAEMLGTAENLQLLRSAATVEACMLRRTRAPRGRPYTEDRYEETTFVTVPLPLAAALRSKLLAEGSYKWPSGGYYSVSLCEPIYHSRLRFSEAGKTLAVDFCFFCGILQIYRDGRPIDSEIFITPDFLTALRAIFPDDKDLAYAAALKDRAKP